jgi:diguanylate cyclase (GGDEF)-like protein/PAS domain S-box-containing protein
LFAAGLLSALPAGAAPAGGASRLDPGLLALVLAGYGLLLLWSLQLTRRARRQTRELQGALETMARTIEILPDPLIEVAADGRILAVHSDGNPLVPLEEVQQPGRRLPEMLSAGAGATLAEALAEASRSGTSHGRLIEVLYPQGSRWFELSVTRRRLKGQQEERFLMLCRDVTQRRSDQVQITRLARLYQALSESNQAIVRLSDGPALLREICRIAVESGGLKMAWAGMLEPGETRLRPIAFYGTGTAYLETLTVSTDPAVPGGNGPVGKALREDRPHWCQDFLADEGLAHLRQEARRYGWGSVAALPLHREGQVIGALALYMEEREGFDSRVQALLQDMAHDIDLALERIGARAARQRLQAELVASEANYRELIESIHDVVWTLDPATMQFLQVSPSVHRLTGYRPSEVLGRPFTDLIQPERREEITSQIQAELQEFEEGIRSGEIVSVDEVELVGKDGSRVWTEMVTKLVCSIRSGRVELHGVSRDITERRFALEQIHRLAYCDPLTGLPNRTQLQERFRRSLEQARLRDRPLSLLHVDLDRFKHVNDSLGHRLGDRVLQEIARRLSVQLRPGDTLSRGAADEFQVLLPDTDAATALELAQRMIEAVAQPVPIGTPPLYLTASAGVAVYPTDGSDLETLLRNADIAMHQAKREGRNRLQFFTAALQERSGRDLVLSNALHEALQHDQLSLLYQAQVDSGSRCILGAEALLRWHHPSYGAISPAEFIPLAERNGLIVPIGLWVLERAIRDASRWPAAADGSLPRVAVNLSAIQFRQKGLAARVLRLLEAHGLAPERLELELTESVTMDNPRQALALMDQLQERGIQLAIDDFGTGYSSLSYLKRLRVHRLKIDQSFIRELETSGDDRMIITTVIQLAHSMGMDVVAEGVETEEQLEWLHAHGCDAIQGYRISRPIPDQAFRELLESSCVQGSRSASG